MNKASQLQVQMLLDLLREDVTGNSRSLTESGMCHYQQKPEAGADSRKRDMIL